MQVAFGRFGRSGSALAAVVAICAVGLVEAGSAAALGDLSLKPGQAGCVTESGNGGACQKGRGLNGASDVAASPDGKNLYVASPNGQSLVVLDRDPATGALTQKAGEAGCFHDPTGSTGGADGCKAGVLGRAEDVEVSPDGRNLYVSGENTLAAFSRAADGSLTEIGCFTKSGAGAGCQAEPLLDQFTTVGLSPDGKSVYVTTLIGGFGGVITFRRDPATGALTREPGIAGCIATLAKPGACQGSAAVFDPDGVLVSPDGRSLYLPVFNGPGAILQRAADGTLNNPVCFTGPVNPQHNTCDEEPDFDDPRALTLSPDGTTLYGLFIPVNFVQHVTELLSFHRDPTTGLLTRVSCISSAADDRQCKTAASISDAATIATSPDGRSVYVTSFTGTVSVFDRDPGTGALTQKAGTAGCLSKGGQGGCGTAALPDTDGLALSPEGNDLYATSSEGGGIEAFDRKALPEVRGFTLNPSKLVLSGKKRIKRPGFRFTLNESASVAIAIRTTGPGRKVGKACKAPTRKTAKHKRCKRSIQVRGVSAQGTRGANSLAYSAKKGKRPLPPGTYTATILATDSVGDVSAPQQTTFHVLKPHKPKHHRRKPHPHHHL